METAVTDQRVRPDVFLDLEQAAEIMDVRPQTVAGYIKNGRLFGEQDGKSFRILAGEVYKYVDNRNPMLSQGGRNSGKSRKLKTQQRRNLENGPVTISTPPESAPTAIVPVDDDTVIAVHEWERSLADPPLSEVEDRITAELARVNRTMDELLIRREELTTALRAMDTIRRFI